MPISLVDFGTVGPIGSDNVVFPITTVVPIAPTAYTAVVDLADMASGDTIVVRVTSDVNAVAVILWEETFTGAQTVGCPVPPLVADEEVTLSYEQTAGGGDVSVSFKMWAVE